MTARHMKGIRLVVVSTSTSGVWFTLRYLDRGGRDQQTPEGFLTYHELCVLVKGIERKQNEAAQAELPWFGN